jgi:hypothetical protein
MEELQKEVQKTKIDTAIITETKRKNTGSENLGKYVMIYCGVPNSHWATSGVAVLLRNDWKQNLQDYTWILDRIILTRLKLLN